MAPDLDPVLAWVMTASWASFLAVWLAGLVYNLLRAPKCVARRFSPAVFVGVAVAYVAPFVVPNRVWDALTFDQRSLQIAGLVILVAGTAFAIRARLALGTMWTNIPALRREHELRTTGPYALTRHPIYTGVLLMLVGTTLAFGAGSYLAALVAGAVGLVQNMRAEEKLLVQAFGERYEAYRRAVPALLPMPRMRRVRVLAQPH